MAALKPTFRTSNWHALVGFLPTTLARFQHILEARIHFVLRHKSGRSDRICTCDLKLPELARWLLRYAPNREHPDAVPLMLERPAQDSALYGRKADVRRKWRDWPESHRFTSP